VRLFKSSVFLAAIALGLLLAALQLNSGVFTVVGLLLIVAAIVAYRSAVGGPGGRIAVGFANRSRMYRAKSVEIGVRASARSESVLNSWTEEAKQHRYRLAGPPRTQHTPLGALIRTTFVRDAADTPSRDIHQP
jgi:hypothetical protein